MKRAQITDRLADFQDLIEWPVDAQAVRREMGWWGFEPASLSPEKFALLRQYVVCTLPTGSFRVGPGFSKQTGGKVVWR